MTAKEAAVSAIGPTAQIETITPALAEAWLGKNRQNRGMRKRTLNLFTRDMLEGNWQLTGEAIKFDTEGWLLDGQHRLQAVINSGCSIPMFVIRGIDPQAKYVLDTGTKRTAADALKIRDGVSQPALTASTTKWCYIFDEGLLYDWENRTASNADVLAFYDLYTDQILAAVQMARQPSHHSLLQPTIGCTAAFLCSRIDAQAAHEFFARLGDGVGLPPGSPILALRSRLAEISRKRTRLNPEDALSLVIRAWNSWRTGRTMAQIPVFQGGTAIRCPIPK